MVIAMKSHSSIDASVKITTIACGGTECVLAYLLRFWWESPEKTSNPTVLHARACWIGLIRRYPRDTCLEVASMRPNTLTKPWGIVSGLDNRGNSNSINFWNCFSWEGPTPASWSDRTQKRVKVWLLPNSLSNLTHLWVTGYFESCDLHLPLTMPCYPQSSLTLPCLFVYQRQSLNKTLWNRVGH